MMTTCMTCRAYSRFPEVEIVQSTSARATISKLDSILSRQGNPITIKTDNGPPFNDQDFADYVECQGIEQQRVTPLRPRANGEVERFIKTLTKATTTFINRTLKINNIL